MCYRKLWQIHEIQSSKNGFSVTAMDRARKAEPHANEAIWTREVSRNLENHIARVNHAQPSIDTSKPKTVATAQGLSKKNQIKEDRLDAIEIENRRLLERIATIALATTKDQQEHHKHANGKKGLHDGLRMREQEKIWQENQVRTYHNTLNRCRIKI
jgi:hypothetical protein